MYCDLVLKGCQSVLRTLVLVPLVLVFLFGSAKIGRSAIDACGVIVVSKWRGSLFPVASLSDLKPSREEVELAWTPASLRKQQAARALTNFASFFSESSCISMRLCELFGERNEVDGIIQACKCFVCHSELPLI